MKTPICSVVIPVYNAENVIESAVKSVLEQTFDDFEIVIIDDCSTDGSYKKLVNISSSNAKIKLYKNEHNLGVANTRNKAISYCCGCFIAFIDADDMWLPQKLNLQFDLINQSGCDICYSSYEMLDQLGNPINHIYYVPNSATFESMLYENVIGCSSAVVRRECLLKYPMNADYSHEDYALWLTLLNNGYTARGCIEPLVKYRSSGGRSANKLRAAVNRFKIYNDMLHLGIFKSCLCFTVYSFKGVIKHFFHR